MLRKQGKTLVRLVTLFATGIAVGALVGCSLGGASPAQSGPQPTTAQAAATPAPTQVLPPRVTTTLGPPPTDCPKAPPTKTLRVPDFGGGFSGDITFLGDSPAWELGFETNGVFAALGSTYPSSKIMWVVGPNVNQPVTLSGQDLRNDTPLWFEMFPSNSGGGKDYFTTSAVLDPSAPNRGSTDNSKGHWNIWGIGIIVSAASCYQLDVTSAAGSWHTIFAAGTDNP